MSSRDESTSDVQQQPSLDFLIQEIQKIETPKSGRLKEALSSTGAVLIALICLALPIVLLGLLFRGADWIATVMYPWALTITEVVSLVIVPVSLILLIPLRTRNLGAVGLLADSYLLGSVLWIYSFLLCLHFGGAWAAIIGILMGGIGVFPIALILALWNASWSVLCQLIVWVAIVYLLRIPSTLVD